MQVFAQGDEVNKAIATGKNLRRRSPAGVFSLLTRVENFTEVFPGWQATT
jgi:hypothetical protein